MTDTPEPAALARTVTRGAGIAGAGTVISQLLTLGAYVALARLASPEAFGELAAGSVLVGLGALVADSGLAAALIQRRDRVEEAAATALVATLASGLVLALVALAGAPLLGLIFGDPTVTAVAAAMAGMLLLRAPALVPGALLVRRFSFVRRLVVEPLAVVAYGVTAITACANGLGVWGLVLGAYASVLVTVVASWAVVGWRPQLRLASFAMWRELAGFGRHVLASEGVRRGADELDTFVVGGLLGTPLLGQYRFGIRVGTQPLLLMVHSAAFVLYPAFARIADDPVRLRRAAVRALRWTCVLGFPGALLLLALGEPLITLVFGERWRTAGHVVMALCLYPVGHLLVSVATEVFKAVGRPSLLTRMYLVSFALSGALMLAGAPLGVVWVAAGASAAALGVGAWALRVTAGVLGTPVRALAAEIWAPALAAAAMSGLLLAGDRLLVHAGERSTALGIGLLAVEALAGIAVYALLLAAVAPAVRREVLAAGRGLAERRAEPSPRSEPV